MTIGFDGHFIGARVSGNGVSTRLLLRALAEVDSENRYTVYLLRNGLELDNGNFRLKVMHPLHASPHMRFLFTFPQELRLHPVDIFHGIFTAPLLPKRPWPKIVLTVPEVPWFTDPGSFPASRLFSAQVRLTTRYSIARASRIITLTQFMKGQLENHFGVPADKIDVIPWGVDETYFTPVRKVAIENVRRRFSLSSPYILCVGDLHPRKNQIALIRAYSKLKETSNIPHSLVLAGKPLHRTEQIYAAAEASPAGSHIRLVGYIEPDDLRALYQGADIFAFPSLHEGFGLPVHEAMASGVAVVVSDRDALPEVSGDAALLVDPLDVDSIASAIQRLIDDAALKQRLVEKGFAQARRFSWRETARAVVETYRRALLTAGEVSA